MLRNSCTNCHLPFILNREALQIALDEVDKEGYKHYNVYCNNCGRPNKVSRKQLVRSAPWWKSSTNKADPAKSAKAGKSIQAEKFAKPKTNVKSKVRKSKSASKAASTKARAKKNESKPAKKPATANAKSGAKKKVSSPSTKTI